MAHQKIRLREVADLPSLPINKAEGYRKLSGEVVTGIL